ncbi:MAG: inorganic diphosphatase [Nanoarchaeota archaeon]|nr:inorganic diphosphatase [Nanoarchaeota archaeon]MEC8339960.1 inorganic diphosphatase [Nanoarchaeota archaeon]
MEISKGSRVKYEVDKDTGLIMFDRVLYSPMHYSANYGFVPQTLWEDGDPLDVLVLSEEPLVPGCIVKCRALGVLDMIDGGEGDAKVLAVPVKDPRFAHMKEITDVAPHLLAEMQEFFKVYKNLQKKEVEVGAWEDRATAIESIQKSFELYDKEYKN